MTREEFKRGCELLNEHQSQNDGSGGSGGGGGGGSEGYDADEIFALIDSDGSGEIDIQEFASGFERSRRVG